MGKNDKLHEKWQGTPTGETLLRIERLHEVLAAQSAAEQEVTRQQIDELVRTLRQGSVFGKYDAHSGFVQEPPSKQRRKKG